jgi:sugar lactone lactonase YvrE
MYVMPDGGIYVGNFGAEKGEPNHAGEVERSLTRLIYVDSQREARVVGGELHFPNAMVTRNGKLIVAESFAHRLTEYTIGAGGELVDERLYADLSPHQPDGICIDAEGGIWAACPLSAVVRVDTDGSVTDQIDRKATACALGGDDGSTLFLAGSDFDTLNDIFDMTAKGYIETVEVDVPAVGMDS